MTKTSLFSVGAAPAITSTERAARLLKNEKNGDNVGTSFANIV